MHFVLQAINIKLQLYPTVDKPKILSPYEIYSVHTPEVSPHTIECVFVGFGLFQICSPFFFSPHSKDHALHHSQ